MSQQTHAVGVFSWTSHSFQRTGLFSLWFFSWVWGDGDTPSRLHMLCKHSVTGLLPPSHVHHRKWLHRTRSPLLQTMSATPCKGNSEFHYSQLFPEGTAASMTPKLPWFRALALGCFLLETHSVPLLSCTLRLKGPLAVSPESCYFCNHCNGKFGSGFFQNPTATRVLQCSCAQWRFVTGAEVSFTTLLFWLS